MAKYMNPSAMDAAHAWIRDNATMASYCSTQPTNVTEAIATYALGTIAVASGNWAIGAGDVSGRKIRYAGCTMAIGTAGNGGHMAFYNSGTLIAVGTCAVTAVSAGGSVIVAAFDLNEITDIA